MKTTGKILHTIFSLLFLAFLGLICYESRVKILKLTQGNRTGLFAILTVFFLLAFYFLLRKIHFPAWSLGAASIGFSVIARGIASRFIGPYMTMRYDYLTALESARGVFASKEAIFTHWGFYPRLLSVWMKVFGDSYASAVWFNIAVCALSVLLVFLIAQQIWNRPIASFTASAIFGLWPSYVLYTCITSNEHLAIFFMLLSAWLMILAWKGNVPGEGDTDPKPRNKDDENTKSCYKVEHAKHRKLIRWVLTLLAGISAGCADCFKEFSPVFAIAVFAAGFVFWLIKGRYAAIKGFPCLLLSVLLVFSSALVTHKAALKYLENYLGQPVCEGATAHFLWIGLNSQSGGMWSSETGMKVYEFAEQYNNDYEKVMDQLWSLLEEDLKAHPESLRPTIEHKMEVDWAADSGVIDWIVALYQDNQLPHKDFIYAACAGFYVGIMVLMGLGTLLEAAYLWKASSTDPSVFHDLANYRDRAKLKGQSLMYFRLICFGYGLLLLLSEAQGRYQLVLFPCFALLASACLCEIWRKE